MDKAFCIGNGTSRLGFDLNRLRGIGTRIRALALDYIDYIELYRLYSKVTYTNGLLY